MPSELDWWDKAVLDLNNYWEPDTAKKQIRTKDLTGWRRHYLRWIKRFTIKELYVWTASNWGRPQLMSEDDPIDHGNFKLSKSLERKLSRMFQLKNGWTIRESDLKYLVSGPLISEDGHRIVVPSHGRIVSLFVWLEQYWRYIAPPIGITLFVIAILKLISGAG